MTRTGYSCLHLRRKSKTGCRKAVSYYCTRTGRYIDPMSCHQKCGQFNFLLSPRSRASKKQIATELL